MAQDHIQELRQAYNHYLRQNDPSPGYERQALEHLIRYRMIDEDFGFVLWQDFANLDDETIETEITTQMDYFKSINAEFEWKVLDYDEPLDLRDRLKARGFNVTFEDSEAVMVLDLEKAPARLLETPTLDVRKITLADIDHAHHVRQAAFPDTPPRAGEYIKYMLETHPDMMSMYVGYDGDIPVAQGRINYSTSDAQNPFVSIWAGGVLESHRGKGYYTALLQARIQEARERGYRYMVIDATETSRPIVTKFGFVQIGRAYACTWE